MSVMIYIYIYTYHHNHHVTPSARISLTLCHHHSLSSIAFERSCISTELLYVGARWSSSFARPCEGVHRSMSLLSLSILLQQCPACLVRLTWIVLWWVVGGRTAAVLWGVASRTCSILLAAFSCSCFIHVMHVDTVVSTRQLLGKNCVSFYRSGLTSISLAYIYIYICDISFNKVYCLRLYKMLIFF